MIPNIYRRFGNTAAFWAFFASPKIGGIEGFDCIY